MPVVGIPVHLLEARLGRSMDRDMLVEHLQHMGCDVEGHATLQRFKCARCSNILEITETQDPPTSCRRCGTDFTADQSLRQELGESEVIRMELLAVRPDMFDPGGLARALRGYLEVDSGEAGYPTAPSGAAVEVHPDMSTPACPRPAIACAVLRDVTLDDDIIKVLMNLQENLHWALGRDRKHASIGVYDLDTIAWGSMPVFQYRPVDPDGIRFVPLGSDPDDPSATATPRAILEDHPKGREFARLLRGFSRYPLLLDASGGVLSMPPIINSEETRVRDATTDLFVDVTGTNRRLVSRALNVLVTSLAELVPGLRIEQVEIRYPDATLTTPDFTRQEVHLGVEETARLLGIPLDAPALTRLLERMGHDVEPLADAQSAPRLRVLVPAWRNDILHSRDLMEDAAIAYGYHNIEPCLVPTMTVGEERPVELVSQVTREAITGLGFMEVMTLQLTSEARAFDALRLPRGECHVLLENPIARDQTILRPTLLPGLLETLTANAHREYPQRLFEVGEVTVLDPDAETGAREVIHVVGVVIGDRVGATDARAAAEALLREHGLGIRTVASDSPTFLPGRGAIILARNEDIEREVGCLGELHPEVLEAFRLRFGVAMFKVDLTALHGVS